MNITITLSRYIDLLCRHHDYAFITSSEASETEKCVGYGELCHLEPLENGLVKLWRIEGWRASEIHRRELKVAQHKGMLRSEAYKQVKRALVQGIISKAGCNEGIAAQIAEHIINVKNVEVAKIYGVESISIPSLDEIEVNMEDVI